MVLKLDVILLCWRQVSIACMLLVVKWVFLSPLFVLPVENVWKRQKTPTSLPILFATELNMYSLFLTLSLKLYTSFAIGLQSMWLLKLLRAHFLLAAELSKRKGQLILTASKLKSSSASQRTISKRNARQTEAAQQIQFVRFVLCVEWLVMVVDHKTGNRE